MKVQRNQMIIFASVALGLVGGYLAYSRFSSPARPKLRKHIARKLPVSKSLSTITDYHGNYDIDGVSFDTEGVIVSGDANKGLHI